MVFPPLFFPSGAKGAHSGVAGNEYILMPEDAGNERPCQPIVFCACAFFQLLLFLGPKTKSRKQILVIHFLCV